MAEVYMAAAATVISRRRRTTKPVEINIDEALTNIRPGNINNPEVYSNICTNLGSTIESAIVMKAVPSASYLHQLLLIAKEVYSRRTKYLQPWLMLLLLPLKDACEVGWFLDGDKDDLLMMENEISYGFSKTDEMSTEQSNAHSSVSNIVSRFYPTMKLENILTSVTAKAGSRTYSADFHISLDKLPTQCQNLFLLVARLDSMDTSACIVRPSNVKFLLNDYEVLIKDYEVLNLTKINMDKEPQLPSNVTKLMKNGLNRLQVRGDFDGQYIIAVAFMSSIPCPDPPQLQDYVHFVSLGDDSDCEIVEMPTRISLDCPISQLRIKTPVKGHLCEHRQCFEYNYFMKVNAIRPTWKCPVCNKPVCNLDIRIDQDFLKILNEVAKGVSDVTISPDGSWLAGMAEKSAETRRRTKTQNTSVPDIDGNLISKEAGIADPTVSHNSRGSAVNVSAERPSLTSVTTAVSPPPPTATTTSPVFTYSSLQSQILNKMAKGFSDLTESPDGSRVAGMAEKSTETWRKTNTQNNRVPDIDEYLTTREANVALPNSLLASQNSGGLAVNVTAERKSSTLTKPAVSPTQVFMDSRMQSQSSNDPVHNTPPSVKHSSGGSAVNVSAKRPSSTSTTPVVSPPPRVFHDSRLQSQGSNDPGHNTPPSVKQTKDHLNRVNFSTTPPPNPFTKPNHPSAESQEQRATQPNLSPSETKKARTTLFTPIQLTPCTSSTNIAESIAERLKRRGEQRHFTPGPSNPTPVPAPATPNERFMRQDQQRRYTPVQSYPTPIQAPAAQISEPNGEMPFGIMRGSLRGTELDVARLQLQQTQQPIQANEPWSIPKVTYPPELQLLMRQQNPQPVLKKSQI